MIKEIEKNAFYVKIIGLLFTGLLVVFDAINDP